MKIIFCPEAYENLDQNVVTKKPPGKVVGKRLVSSWRYIYKFWEIVRFLELRLFNRFRL
jgi:hypothetical protein